jgi:hypothetical protein
VDDAVVGGLDRAAGGDLRVDDAVLGERLRRPDGRDGDDRRGQDPPAASTRIFMTCPFNSNNSSFRKPGVPFGRGRLMAGIRSPV